MLPLPRCVLFEDDQGAHAKFELLDFDPVLLTLAILTQCTARDRHLCEDCQWLLWSNIFPR